MFKNSHKTHNSGHQNSQEHTVVVLPTKTYVDKSNFSLLVLNILYEAREGLQ